MNRIITVVLLLIIFSSAIGQQNWHLKDYKKDKLVGISLNEAYDLLKKSGRTSQPVIVAIIDSGVDTTHSDIKNFLWTNPKEIPGNGIDDDNNGYIDDIHGWNFLGNSKGENVDGETLELTRLYKKYSEKFANKDRNQLLPEEQKEYDQYLTIKEEYENTVNEKLANYNYLKSLDNRITPIIIKLKKAYNIDTLSTEIIEKMTKDSNDTIRNLAKYLLLQNIDLKALREQINYLEKELTIKYNVNYDGRSIIGDDPANINDSIYGNNDIMGKSSDHGTFVAGIIGADRNNDNEAYGIADNVRFMVLRAVPGGDERDKDVALAIRYAVRNGAKVINMSFGKPYSPEKHFVDDALRYAAKHKVLCIHAAGNDAENNDIATHYPSNYDKNGNPLTPYWIDVAASNKYADVELPANFTNYGKKTVDLFAPGVSIYSIRPGNRFQSSNGTSAACPVVTGIAALIMSYFPELTTDEVYTILLKSVIKFKHKVNVPSKDNLGYFDVVKFTELSKTGGVVNAANAVKLAIRIAKSKKK